MRIHPTAIIEDGAELGEGVSVGAYCVVGPDVKLGPGVVLHPQVTIAGATEIGARTVVHSFASLGGAPQHLAYRGEKTRLIIGADNIIREHVTMNVGTAAGRGETRIGGRGFFMIACHVAHDCIVGDHVIMANNATIGGHVIVEDYAFLGGLCAVHQHCRIGAQAFVGGCAMATTDVIPYGLAVGNHASLAGLNIVGLKRRGHPREVIHEMRSAYKALFADGGTFQQRIVAVRAEYGRRPEIARILDFITADAPRPLMMPAR
jgi:UDP-N-acetylglucosamine acyltransferase